MGFVFVALGISFLPNPLTIWQIFNSRAVSKQLPANLSCVQIPVSFFPLLNRPVIKVKIDEQKYALLIDLGSSHPLDLQRRFLDDILQKKSIGTSNYIGIRGNGYPTEGFQIPALEISNLKISGLVAFEENMNFINDSKIRSYTGLLDLFNDRLRKTLINGRIGWTVFKEFHCFFDFPNSVLFLSENKDGLIQKTGCSFDDFIYVPFETEKYGIVISTEGNKRFLLDTGATRSVARNDYALEGLVIGGHDFGKWNFAVFEFTDKIDCDGILGIDFFKKHAIYFDFHNKVAYIKRHKTTGERLIYTNNLKNRFLPASDSH